MKKFIIVLILLCFCAPVMASEYPKVSRRNIVINERTGEQVQTKEKQSSYQVLKQKLLDAQEENENLVRIIESQAAEQPKPEVKVVKQDVFRWDAIIGAFIFGAILL